ncbi:MAG TPA: VPLPA-CTERM sorting domain-containing protein [Roseibacterium sp.]|nr:VPLPA-CTERM sorting domain-containing protein [Roseibacterium sp.]
MFKYVVEYDAAPISPVPIPASLPLIVGGLGLMGFLGRRRKTS